MSLLPTDDAKIKYYALLFRHEGKNRYLIWYATAYDDYVVADANEEIPIFNSLTELAAYAQGNNISIVSEEQLLHDLDYIAALPKSIDITTVDFAKILAAWNLFWDVARSIGAEGKSFLDLHENGRGQYDIICGLNDIPPGYPMAPRNELLVKLDAKFLTMILKTGLELFRKKIRMEK